MSPAGSAQLARNRQASLCLFSQCRPDLERNEAQPQKQGGAGSGMGLGGNRAWDTGGVGRRWVRHGSPSHGSLQRTNSTARENSTSTWPEATHTHPRELSRNHLPRAPSGKSRTRKEEQAFNRGVRTPHWSPSSSASAHAGRQGTVAQVPAACSPHGPGPDGALGCWIRPGPAWRGNETMQDRPFLPSLNLSNYGEKRRSTEQMLPSGPRSDSSQGPPRGSQLQEGPRNRQEANTSGQLHSPSSGIFPQISLKCNWVSSQGQGLGMSPAGGEKPPGDAFSSDH